MLQPCLHQLAELPLLSSILLKVTILLATAWAFQFLLRKSNPYWRVLLWRCVGGAIVATPLLILFTPAIRIALPAAGSAVTAPSTTFITETAHSDLIRPTSDGPNIVGLTQASTESTAPASPSCSARLSQTASQLLWSHCGTGLTAAWVLGIVVLASGWARAWLRLHRLLSQSRPASDEIRQALHRVSRALGCHLPVSVRIAPVPGPLLTGMREPTILLPQGVSAGNTEFSAVFAHELTHLLNRDLFWMSLLRGITVAFWWHPLSFHLCRVHEQACEEACDAAAARHIGDPEAYSRTLAHFALSALRPSPTLAGIPMARPAEIMHRLARLSTQANISRPCATRVIAVTAVSALLAVTLNSVQLVNADTASTPPTAAAAQARMLHFTPTRSVGKLYIQDASLRREIADFHHWIDGVSDRWQLLGEARGDVSVPAGKRVSLVVSREGWRNLAPLDKLAPDDLDQLAFEGTGISPEENRRQGFPPLRNAPDSVMQHVGRLTGLKVLDLQTTDVTSKAMRHIEKLKSLECLYLPRQIDDSAMPHVATLTTLKRLYFKGNEVTDQGLTTLAKLKNLEELEIGGNKMGDQALAPLAGLPRLHYLLLWSNAFTDKALEPLKSIPDLRTLVLFKTERITDAGLAEVAQVPTLQRLSLPWMKQIGDQGVAHIAKLSDLRMLDITHTTATDKGIAELKNLHKLEFLSMRAQANEPVVAAVLENQPHLRNFTCGGTSSSDYSDDLVERIARLTELEELVIGGKHITDKGIARLADCRKLRHLTLFECPFTDKGLAELGRLDALERLEIFNAKLTTSGLSSLNKLTRLENLRFSRVSPGDAHMDLSGLVNLRSLIIGSGFSGPPLRDADLACLANLKNLQSFQMDFCRGIGDAGLAHLAGLTRMTRLSIGGNLTDAGLAHLAAMDHLQSLTIAGNITEQGILQLAKNQALGTIDVITPNSMSKDLAATMHERLPKLLRLRYGKDNESLQTAQVARIGQ